MESPSKEAAPPEKRSSGGFTTVLLFLLLVGIAGRNLDRVIPGATDRWLRPLGLAPPATAAVVPEITYLPEPPPPPLDLSVAEPPAAEEVRFTAWFGPSGLPILVGLPAESLLDEGDEGEPAEEGVTQTPAGEEEPATAAEEPAEAAGEPVAAPPPQEPPPRKPPPAPAKMEVVYVNRLKAAYIGVWADKEKKAYDRVEATTFMKRRVGQEYRRVVEIPAGLRTIEVRISDVAKGKVETTKTLRRSFKSRKFYRLRVELDKDDTLSLSLEEP